ncbi:MAG: FKBP-type peptidyl-prolyl cis-trans isomerase [Luteimonas sp.]
MKFSSCGLAALLLAAVALPAATVTAQDLSVLTSDRDKVSYMIGMDVAKSIAPAIPDIDIAALERALSNAFDAGTPLITEDEIKSTGQALRQRIAARGGQAVAGVAPGTEPPAVAKDKVGLLVGTDVGRSLVPIKDEIALPVLMQGLRTARAGGTTLLSTADADTLRTAFGERMRVRLQAEAAKVGEINAAAGREFLAKNKTAKDVFTTPSGLQYMVIRQGEGRRPQPSDRVRVNYRGTLLDGKVFDSSYERGEPAEFALTQVIAGWTEGVALMPVGASYRFWIPSDLAYGPNGNPSIGPNSTLAFDVELLDVL